MILCTWNADRGRAEVKLPYLFDAFSPDLAAVQEVSELPTGFTGSWLWKGAQDGKPNQGVLLWAAPGYRLETIDGFQPETELYLAARLYRGDAFLCNVVCAWVKPCKEAQPEYTCKYVQSLDLALQSISESVQSQPSLIMGDFNMRGPLSKGELAQFVREVLDSESAYHRFFSERIGEESLPTLRHKGRGHTEHHIDWCFVPTRWARGVRAVIVGAEAEWAGLSDHRPISVDVDDALARPRPARKAAALAG